MSDSAATVLNQWEQLINRMVFLEKRFVFTYADLRLHPSELHVLLAVRADPGANATRLAERLGVTKGAISQVLKRLVTKGVIGKRVDTSQKNEITAFFTPLGQAALTAFLADRAGIRERFAAYLGALPETERETIRCFLEHAAGFLP